VRYVERDDDGDSTITTVTDILAEDVPSSSLPVSQSRRGNDSYISELTGDVTGSFRHSPKEVRRGSLKTPPVSALASTSKRHGSGKTATRSQWPPSTQSN